MQSKEDLIADAFELATPVSELELVQHTSFETSRLRTKSGSFLVKRLWGLEDPVWRPHIERAMSLECAALAKGVPIARPIVPVSAAFGYAARINGFGTVRVYDWIEHRPLEAADDISRWLGSVASELHGLKRLPSSETPEWRWWGVFPRERWQELIQDGLGRGFPWAKVAQEKLGFICETSDRVRDTFSIAADPVLSHGDIEPYNVLMSGQGPVLIDWESVACESATLEIGRAALTFGRSDPDQVTAILQAYTDAGGAVANVGNGLFFRRVALELCHITERIGVMLMDDVAPGWMEGKDLAAETSRALADLPALVRRLETMAVACGI